MNQALHIFKKDVRQFWHEIAIVLAMTLLFVFTAAQPWAALQRRAEPPNSVSSLFTIVLPIAWCFLIARVIHAEVLPGERQFWLTRPYSRKNLIGAKALFIVAFVNLPLLIAQTAIIAIDGFPIASNVAGLLWDQVLITAVVVLPAMALAAVTENITQFGMGVLMLAIVNFSFSSWLSAKGAGMFGPIEWLRDSGVIAIIVFAGLAILFLQFMSRRTLLSRGLASGGVILTVVAYVFAPWAPLFAIQTHLGQPFHGSLQIALDRGRTPYRAAGDVFASMTPDRRAIVLPFLVSGLPPEGELQYEGAAIRLAAASGEISNLGPAHSSVGPKPSGFVARIMVDRGFFDRVGNKPIRAHVRLYLTEFGNRRSTTIPLGQTAANVPGVGQCFSGPDYLQRDIMCRTALRWPSLQISAQVQGNYVSYFTRAISYSPFPATLLIDPVESYWASSYTASELGPEGAVAPSRAQIITKEPISHFHYEFDIPDIILQDFALPEKKRLPPR